MKIGKWKYKKVPADDEDKKNPPLGLYVAKKTNTSKVIAFIAGIIEC